MNNEKLMRSMEHIDDKYIEEANPAKAKAIREKRLNKTMVIIAACICCAFTVLNVWLFLPIKNELPDVSQYKNNEYYEVIQNLNKVMNASKPKYANNFDKYIMSNDFTLFGMFAKKDSKDEFMTGAAAGVDETMLGEGSERYEEVTDNQVNAVIEADKIKRSDKYIYHMNREGISIYTIDKEESKKIGTYKFNSSKGYNTEFYLSKDCKTITIIYEIFAGERTIVLKTLDVSDPTNIKEKKTVSIKGAYISSRYVNDELLIISRFNASNVDFSNESTFIPQIDTGEGYKSIPASCITMPDEITNTQYTFVTKFDANTLELCDMAAYLSYSKTVYVTAENVYLTYGYTKEIEHKDSVSDVDKTDIICLNYAGDTFTQKGAITIDGMVKNQYSLDEYNGILRVVTTTRHFRENKNDRIKVAYVDTGRNAALYCIDLSKWEVVSSVVNFAPWGETVRSVRFDKDKAYVCTAVEFTDPVFFFDLSDINNITYKETEEIDGYSTSLVNFGNGYLLGIGYSARDSIKIEIYKEVANGVESVCKYEKNTVEFSQDYKSYYINRKEQLVGVSINSYNERVTEYVLFKFDGYELVELVRQELDGNYEYHRGVLIDGYFYMFGENDFVVKNLNDN